MSKKLIITVGCSGSGKSTWTHREWLKNPNNIVIVNRDKIRELLFGYTETNVNEYYQRKDLNKLEKQVTKYEDTLINEGLCENKTVIVDATHLQEKYIKRFEYWNVLTEIIWFHIELEHVLILNKQRVRQVDEQIIKKQHFQFLQIYEKLKNYKFSKTQIFNDFTKPNCWIFDIDGTLAHANGRNPYNETNVFNDLVDYSLVEIFRSLSSINIQNIEEPLFFCSGRSEKCRKDTEKWLNYHIQDIVPYKLFMRKENDNRPDYVVKKEMYGEITKTNYIAGIFDDRLQVVRYARSLGLKVLNVEYNNF
jgi:predicted kinase